MLDRHALEGRQTCYCWECFGKLKQRPNHWPMCGQSDKCRQLLTRTSLRNFHDPPGEGVVIPYGHVMSSECARQWFTGHQEFPFCRKAQTDYHLFFPHKSSGRVQEA
jgi:hypothetical protein